MSGISKLLRTMNVKQNPIQTLVVEDSKDECVLIRALFRSMTSIKLIGFIQDGGEAISYLEGIEQFKLREMFPYPDLLLLDFNMPHCDGMRVLEFLQQQIHRPRIILWSNTLERVDVSRALCLGADMVCAKPKNRQELLNIIHRIKAKAFKMPLAAPYVVQPESGCMSA